MEPLFIEVLLMQVQKYNVTAITSHRANHSKGRKSERKNPIEQQSMQYKALPSGFLLRRFLQSSAL
jgi:hypothetical protein